MTAHVSARKVRLGLVGVGTMGGFHTNLLCNDTIPNCDLAAVCDLNPERIKNYPSGFLSSEQMFDSGKVDAVLIATPHFSHTRIGIQALQRNLHVLVEKPISAHKEDAEQLIAAHQNPDQVFAAVFNQRTDPYFIKLHQLVHSGQLGTVRRVQWTITDWFRSEAYYRSSEWRATWAGEGGGVLLNQCPHNLDLYQWIFGMPNLVQAFCRFGRYHDIEVEDDVIAYFQHASGMTAIFIASTGEAPGSNRLEVIADSGRVTIENDRFTFIRNEVPMDEFSRTTSERFGKPSVWNIELPVSGHGPQHQGILENFVAAILEGTALIAPAREGLYSLELANACLLSTWESKPISLPMDAQHYSQRLKERIANSTKQKTTVVAPRDDFSKSFG
ncbi:MAG: Gfo/Idh/MocA family oxidoreductase [Verrucomicrobia bacterium]|nr:Gfo/Idh/MocA family oxidoreductase [Verrucomicrobiota bacterium]MBV9674005.1 Gfo/Idh/MocA family oxidoreductase [Verrucomicrobiota bacterium]